MTHHQLVAIGVLLVLSGVVGVGSRLVRRQRGARRRAATTRTRPPAPLYVPQGKLHRVSAGKGQNKPCDVCGRLIRQAEAEWEITFASGPAVRVHVRCYPEAVGIRRRRPA